MKNLLIDVNANANGDPIIHDGCQPLIAVWATSFGGGTVTIEASPNAGTTWITLTKVVGGTAATFTANSLATLYDVPMGYLIRATLTGSTNPSNVNVQLGN